MAPGVLGITGVETAELALGLTQKLKPSAVLVIDALAAMETSHICTTIQLTDTGISPGSGVGNHRQGINAEWLQVPVIAIGIPMVVYASTIVRDALRRILAKESTIEEAEVMAEELSAGSVGDFVVTPRSIDELVQGLADMLALAIIFVGMSLIETNFAPLGEMPAFQRAFMLLTNPLLGFAVGFIVTSILQSASASVGVL